MIDVKEFRQRAHELADWMADYLENIEHYPVRSKAKPGDTYEKIPEEAPENGEPFDQIMKDFREIILPGITHWQSPKFHAYFPGNSSYPSVLAEMLTATLGAQCMIWETSPAAAELEEKMMNWIRKAMNLPSDFHGVIQDTASTATLVAILSAREAKSHYAINEQGFTGNEHFRIYCSEETHSSIEKAVKIAGLGKRNLVKVAVNDQMAMDPEALEQELAKDVADGLVPLCVIPSLGTTGTVAIDTLSEIIPRAKAQGCWVHVDAAFAGTALLLPELQWMIKGAEKMDSFVFNPHKWMFTNFDCTAYYVRDKEALLRTFEILPEYLKTGTRGKVNDYRDWGIPLGRRFRALKLWFVIRDYGLEGIRSKIRSHLELAKVFEQWVDEADDFEMVVPRTLNTVCFRFIPDQGATEEELEVWNATLLRKVNDSGALYLTHTKVKGIYTLRMVIGQTNVQERHIKEAWHELQLQAASINATATKG